MDYENRLSVKAKSLLQALRQAGVDFGEDQGSSGRLWRALDEESQTGYLTTQTLSEMLKDDELDEAVPALDPASAKPAELATHMATAVLHIFCATTGHCELLMVCESVAFIHGLREGRQEPNEADWKLAEKSLGDDW